VHGTKQKALRAKFIEWLGKCHADFDDPEVTVDDTAAKIKGEHLVYDRVRGCRAVGGSAVLTGGVGLQAFVETRDGRDELRVSTRVRLKHPVDKYVEAPFLRLSFVRLSPSAGVLTGRR
jgi:hypothetical protein